MCTSNKSLVDCLTQTVSGTITGTQGVIMQQATAEQSFWAVLIGIIMWLVWVGIVAIAIMLLWNYVAPRMFGLPTIGFDTAIAFAFLLGFIGMLFK